MVVRRVCTVRLCLQTGATSYQNHSPRLVTFYSEDSCAGFAGWREDTEKNEKKMDSYDSEQRLILQGFSKSTRFAFFCTALIAEIQQIFVKIFGDFAENFAKIKICKNLKNSAKLSLQKMYLYAKNCRF